MIQLTPTGQQQPNLFLFNPKRCLHSSQGMHSNPSSTASCSTTDRTVSEQESVFILYFEPDPTEPHLSGDREPMVHVKLGFLS